MPGINWILGICHIDILFDGKIFPIHKENFIKSGFTTFYILDTVFMFLSVVFCSKDVDFLFFTGILIHVVESMRKLEMGTKFMLT